MDAGDAPLPACVGTAAWRLLYGRPFGEYLSRLFTDPDGHRVLLFRTDGSDVYSFTTTAAAPRWVRVPGSGDPPRWGGLPEVRSRDGRTVFAWDASSLWSYDVATRVWTRSPTSGVRPTHLIGQAAIHDEAANRIVTFGGLVAWASSGDTTDAVYALDLGRLEWTRLATSGPGPLPSFEAHVGYDPGRHALVVALNFMSQWQRGAVFRLPLDGPPIWEALPIAGGRPRNNISNTPPISAGAFDEPAQRLYVYAGGLYALDLLAPELGWRTLEPDGTPHRSHAALAFDGGVNQLFLFSGWPGTTEPTAVWSFDLGGGTWSRLIGPASSYSWFGEDYYRRIAFYDDERDAILHVGTHDAGLILETPLSAPERRLLYLGAPDVVTQDIAVAHDTTRDRLVLLAAGAVYARALTASVAEWTPLATRGAGPSLRRTTMVFDSRRDRMLVYGGQPAAASAVWTLSFDGDPPPWREHEVRGTVPPARKDHSAVYDPVRDRMIVFGGQDASSNVEPIDATSRLDDAWALDLSVSPPSWISLTPAGSHPPGTSVHAAVLDPVNRRMLVAGGLVGATTSTPSTIAPPQATIWSLSLDAEPARWTAYPTTGDAPSLFPPELALFPAAWTRLGLTVVSGGVPGRGDWVIDLDGCPP